MRTEYEYIDMYYNTNCFTLHDLITMIKTEAYNQALDDASRVIDGWPVKIMTISEEVEAILTLKK